MASFVMSRIKSKIQSINFICNKKKIKRNRDLKTIAIKESAID